MNYTTKSITITTRRKKRGKGLTLDYKIDGKPANKFQALRHATTSQENNVELFEMVRDEYFLQKRGFARKVELQVQSRTNAAIKTMIDLFKDNEEGVVL